jgi:hypothetical protein
MATHEGGAYFEAQLPDGSSVVGTAKDEAHARRVIEPMQDGRGHPCDHCARVVVYDPATRRWTHKYGAGVRCFPDKGPADRMACASDDVGPAGAPRSVGRRQLEPAAVSRRTRRWPGTRGRRSRRRC